MEERNAFDKLTNAQKDKFAEKQMCLSCLCRRGPLEAKLGAGVAHDQDLRMRLCAYATCQRAVKRSC